MCTIKHVFKSRPKVDEQVLRSMLTFDLHAEYNSNMQLCSTRTAEKLSVASHTPNQEGKGGSGNLVCSELYQHQDSARPIRLAIKTPHHEPEHP